ncbi:1,3-beta-galactosyl-N-acetylhexosamine phosphorylase [Blautia schinkii]|nr:1,3-beta-galactosyl-N-acetylhexosamine phosphorylase [Blautia schinkii]
MKKRGDFTLPGEAGYEKLTLELAEKWGADMIRDSDGTQLSPELLQAGYGIYSTVCVIREHNEWARENRDKLQQTFLMAGPVTAEDDCVEIELLKDYFSQQFSVNTSPESLELWQVTDRTTEEILPREAWEYHEKTGCVSVKDVKKWHRYSVNFLAYRVWEEISMYNHITNHWDKEHLMQIDPRYEETQEYIFAWMRRWCESHPATKVVRFTSMFYNFVWIWGQSEENRNIFTDWGSYDFTVSPLALKLFEQKYHYALTAEDFINQGKLHVTHMPSGQKKKDWMEFVNDFVIGFGKQLIDIVHEYGKLAYVFYDDSWVGIEPYNGRFEEFGFDGIIKCVFSGYEVRMCAGVPVKSHEIRLHPYLFPVGLGGLPTFAKGGNPTLDAKKYWRNVRRALLRQPVDRIGLGGYLHLTQDYPDFCDYIEQAADEFREIKRLHESGKPYTLKARIAVLHSWGGMRPWTLSGHFHESDSHDLIHINEALAGMPVEVSFLDFQDVVDGKLKDFQIVINAGKAGDAWSGGEAWKDGRVVAELTRWVYEGGTFIGVNEPSATAGYDTYFRMAHILGIDKDMGERVNHGKWQGRDADGIEFCGLIPKGTSLPVNKEIYVYCEDTQVYLKEVGSVQYSVNYVGKGQGIYMSGFTFSPENNRLLLNTILSVCKESGKEAYLTENVNVESAYFPVADTLVFINNSPDVQQVSVQHKGQEVVEELQGFETRMIKLGADDSCR